MRWIARGLMLGSLLAAFVACGAPEAPTAPSSDVTLTARTGAATGARIEGVVRLAGRGDASGIQVFIPGTAQVCFTNRDGTFTLKDVEPGPWSVTARIEGYETATVGNVTIPSDGASGRVFELALVELKRRSAASADAAATQAFGAIEGRVRVAESLDPAAPILVDLSECSVELAGTPYRTQCADDGAFLFWNLPPDTYRLTARLEGYAPRTQSVRVLPGPADAGLDLELTPSSGARNRRIVGQVELTDASGEPTNEFDRVTVQVFGRPLDGDGDESSIANLPSPALAADGSFLIENLAAGSYLLTAFGVGYVLPSPVEANLVHAREQHVTLSLKGTQPAAPKTGRVRGVALKDDPDIRDMSGIAVALLGTSLVAVTDTDGYFVIEGVPAGTYDLLAQAEGYESATAGPLDVTPGEEVELDPIWLTQHLDAPVVLETRPADGARDVLIRKTIPILIRFSKKMHPGSLREAVHIDPEVAHRIFSGKEHPETDDDVMAVVLYGAPARARADGPAADFRTRYTISIDDTAHDFEGTRLAEPFEMSLTTGDPAVIGTRPADGEVKRETSTRRPVIVHFNAQMDPDTLRPDVVDIRPRLSTEPLVSSVTDPMTGWTRMHVSAMWEPDTEYRMTILKRARTTGKRRLANTPYTFTFHTAQERMLEWPEQWGGVHE